MTRGVYYAARLISRQKGTVFERSDYDKIQKVYTIWICPSPSGANTNSIVEYGLKPTKTIGQVNEPVENYDKMKIIIISLNDKGMEGDNSIIRLLSTLLSTTESVEKRKQILESEFNIPMTKEIEEEVLEMCNLGMAVEINATEKTLLDSIKKLMETTKWTVQQAMDALQIPKKDQARYAAMLGSNN